MGASAHRVLLDLGAYKVLKDQQALKDPVVTLAHREQEECKASKVHVVFKALKVPRVDAVLALKEFVVLKVLLAYRALEVSKDHRGILACKALADPRDLQASREHRERVDSKAFKVPRACAERKALLEFRVLKVLSDSKAHKVRKA